MGVLSDIESVMMRERDEFSLMCYELITYFQVFHGRILLVEMSLLTFRNSDYGNV